MGTRGYRIVRYRGRYWIYYNHYDSYPEHFGTRIVAEVPVDRKEYEAWLQQERASYERRLVKIEEHYCIADERVHILKNEKGDAKSEPWMNIRDLEVLPSHFGDAANTVFIEWVYLIDLDEQVFSVNNRVFFNLWNIPRDTWITPFESWDLSTAKCPEASLEPLISAYFADDAERDWYSEVYKGYQHSELNEFPAGIDYNPRQVMALMLYEYLLHPSHSAMWDYVPQWGYTDFAFRELAFAILSLAASEFYLTDVQKLHGHYRHQSTSRGFLVQDDAHDGTEVLPILGTGCHTQGTKPGCAPLETMYYFHGFAILQIIFGQKAQKDVQQFSRGVFPPEIYAEILSYVDPYTELACSKVSPVFRSICQGQVTTPDGLVTKFETIDGEEDKPRAYHQLVPFGTFTFKDMKIATAAQPCRHYDDFPTRFSGPQWCAIIGAGDRKCVIAQARIPIIMTDHDEEENTDD
ncbi:hypothetical protein TESG_07862 [Trichophyton tonsurans CBS 112818]|uniref:F-box domain-containing protein n=1 Tax=Trichophyton tonsurans (strain CBS 112818) TaxID=647933 RepID=F2SAD4_TRIT1|nr:hypothetical protein TESG_07862 [Trichophyton tonsurans CBS 112818]